MASWDQQSAAALTKAREAAVETQLRDVVGPFSPYWRDAVKAARGEGRDGRRGTAALAAIPPSGERDVCPDGDPSRAAALVVQAGERGYALHAPGPRLRRALLRRVVDRRAYTREVESDTRPTSYVLGGLAMSLPFASTRSDLDLVARAGARLWQVLGLGAADVLVSALPHGPTAASQALSLAALAAGTPAFAPGSDPAPVAEALRLLPATVLAAPSETAPELLDVLRRAGAPLTSLRTLLLVGAPGARQRVAARSAAGPDVAVLAVHAPAGARVLWGECRESAGADAGKGPGYHTYPDLELVETVDAETGEADPLTGGELVLTQLGFRGSALVRWRTGDLVAGPVEEEPCPACGRRVPRVSAGLAAGALVPRLALRDGVRQVDLRSVTGALAGTAGLRDWRVVLRRSRRDDSEQMLVHIDAEGDPAELGVSVARDVRRAVGVLPTQVVAGPLPDLDERALSRRTGALPD
jgi:hypothetical protein